MDVFNIFTQTLNSLVSNINYNYLDHAAILSDSWKSRAKTCKIDIQTCINRKIENVNLLAKDDIDENCVKIDKNMEEIDYMNFIILEIDQILDKYIREPLPSKIIEEICHYETFLYSCVMTEEIHNTLIEEIREEERNTEMLRELVVRIDQMWDNDDDEEDIKNYIFQIFKKIYPRVDDSRLKNMSIEYFIYVTQDKNVRINLSSEQIAALKREKYDGNGETCGTCLYEFDQDDETIILPCTGSHRYHPDCIIPWLKMSVVCPTCRSDLR